MNDLKFQERPKRPLDLLLPRMNELARPKFVYEKPSEEKEEVYTPLL